MLKSNEPEFIAINLDNVGCSFRHDCILYNQTYYELTLYMDLFNNEIVAYALSSKKGDVTTYHDGLKQLIEKKKEYTDLKSKITSTNNNKPIELDVISW